MGRFDRREFLAEVGQGMVTVVVGTALAGQMGLAEGAAAEKDRPAPAGLDRLAKLLLETRPEKVLGVYRDQLNRGVALRDLVAGGALANARAFAGQDYDGYHTFMALAPAFAMASELPENERPLPIFKVLYRNSRLIHSHSRGDFLGEEGSAELPADKTASEALVEASHARKVKEADRIVSGMCKKQSAREVYEEVQPLMQDLLNVHRVVLTWRAWEILDFVGKDHARTMLRQTVRHCVDYPNHSVGHDASGMRTILPKLFDTHKLMDKLPGKRKADDAWIEKLARTIYSGKKPDAVGAVAEALAEGFAPDAIASAMSLAGTYLVLGDKGRGHPAPGKPLKSVHGDSVGVHASDAANAWRHIAEVTSARNTFTSLIVGAAHTAGQSRHQMPNLLPLEEDVDKVKGKNEATLLAELDEVIRGNDQMRACAVVKRYGQLGLDARGVFGVLRKYAVSEDGALHAEKYFRTISEEFPRTRSSLRWQHLIALARVTASMYGTPAPGLAEARKALKA
jgi:hypothetical protein